MLRAGFNACRTTLSSKAGALAPGSSSVALVPASDVPSAQASAVLSSESAPKIPNSVRAQSQGYAAFTGGSFAQYAWVTVDNEGVVTLTNTKDESHSFPYGKVACDWAGPVFQAKHPVSFLAHEFDFESLDELRASLDKAEAATLAAAGKDKYVQDSIASSIRTDRGLIVAAFETYRRGLEAKRKEPVESAPSSTTGLIE